jgi:phosphoglycolate phosphatase
MLKSVIFDFDGTIADTYQAIFNIVNQLAVKYGYQPFKPDEIEKFHSQNICQTCKELHIPLIKLPLLLIEGQSMLSQQIADLKPIKDMPETLKDLKRRGYQLCIITSNSQANVNAFLDLNQLNIFDHIEGSNHLFGKAKVIKKYLKQNHLDTSQAMYVGDEIRDIEAARGARIKIISVTWGFNTKSSLLKNHPDFLVETPTDLTKTLISINSN